MPAQPATVVVGVDTHRDFHTAAAVDHLGGLIDTIEIEACESGYARLIEWANALGEWTTAGVEGTGAYGAGLARFLTTHGLTVLEINRPNRQHRRRHGKSDTADALAAARAVLNGDAAGPAKQMSGLVEAIRQLHLVRRSAVKNATAAANQIKDLIVTAPEPIRAELGPLNTRQRVRRAAAWTPQPVTDPTTAARHTIHTLALRWQHHHNEIKTLETQLRPLLQQTCPSLLAEHGVGLDVAAKLVITVGENPQRLRTEASFAACCGTSPVDASSGQQQHHRLNRGGNRQANNALHTVWLVRARTCPQTRTYINNHPHKTRREISRNIKRALARRFHHLLQHDLQPHNWT